ncbi:unnamed protein product [Meganyctiphanes norvegica]|uniref:Chitin-binding type-2 domain-containing protein n=1 Tax=Meganyctiphanes norvegica TaxID=48144 RepID=A0AAV2Q6D8_MEGNR
MRRKMFLIALFLQELFITANGLVNIPECSNSHYPGMSVPDPNDCHQYYICINATTATPKSCKNNDCFNYEVGTCVNDPVQCAKMCGIQSTLVTSSDIISTSQSSPTISTTRVSPSYPDCSNINIPGFAVPDPTNCHRFYTCHNQIPSDTSYMCGGDKCFVDVIAACIDDPDKCSEICQISLSTSTSSSPTVTTIDTIETSETTNQSPSPTSESSSTTGSPEVSSSTSTVTPTTTVTIDSSEITNQSPSSTSKSSTITGSPGVSSSTSSVIPTTTDTIESSKTTNQSPLPTSKSSPSTGSPDVSSSTSSVTPTTTDTIKSSEITNQSPSSTSKSSTTTGIPVVSSSTSSATPTTTDTIKSSETTNQSPSPISESIPTTGTPDVSSSTSSVTPTTAITKSTEITTTPPKITCAGHPVGSMMTDPTDCHKLFICAANGKWYSVPCPDGTCFIESLHTCYENEDVCNAWCNLFSSSSPTKSSMRTTKATTPTIKTTTATTPTIKTTTTTIKTTTTTIKTTTGAHDCIAINDFKCPRYGYFAKCNYCTSSYYSCSKSGANPHEGHCSGSLVFNPDSAYPYCITQDNCPFHPDISKTTTPSSGCIAASEFTCPNSGFFPKCTNCTPYYFKCEHAGRPAQEGICSGTLVFNTDPKYPYCILPDQCPYH